MQISQMWCDQTLLKQFQGLMNNTILMSDHDNLSKCTTSREKT